MVRELISGGKFKTALETAKDFHRAQQTVASEALLLDAYVARIQSLVNQHLEPEAKSLLELVRQRFPAAKDRLNSILVAVSARGGELAGLVQPLNDPELSAERRAHIEKLIQTEVPDLSALANCAALPADHSLRVAAAALDRAFETVTSGAVTDAQIALPEVSRRSPLAPWKMLIRAIACFHRGDDDACRESLAAIQPESVPARLVPAMQAMLGAKPATPLKPAESHLIAATLPTFTELRQALAVMDRAFAEDDGDGPTFTAARNAVSACQRNAPELLTLLKQLIFIRGGVAHMNPERMMAALEGPPRKDAEFFRKYACALEGSSDEEDIAEACELWDQFRKAAVREGWFRDNGLEAATLYLHMADILEKVPEDLLRQVQRSSGWPGGPVAAEGRDFLYPDKLYARACALDPHPEAFSKWLRWASRRSKSKTDDVAKAWHKIRPDDLDPILHLMAEAQKRNAFPTALALLAEAERIDAVHPVVRGARLQLLAGSAVVYVQKNKPHLALEKIAQLETLPHSRQGDRPAFLAALRLLVALASKNVTEADAARRQVESLLGMLGAGLLVFGLAEWAKRPDMVDLAPARKLSKQDRKSLPKAMARVMAIVEDIGFKKFQLPVNYFDETQAQFAGAARTLDVQELRCLGELGIATNRPKLAWAVSGEGLKRGGPSEAHFMLLRAEAIPPGNGPRYLALGAAAVQLGRFHGDMKVVEKATQIVRNPFGGSISLTLDQAREVVRKELASPGYPGPFKPGPDYRHLMPGRIPLIDFAEPEDFGDPFDDDMPDEEELEKIVLASAPKGMPPKLARMLLDALKVGLMNGLTPDEVVAEILGDFAEKPKKGRRK
jgi:hypothetical protein